MTDKPYDPLAEEDQEQALKAAKADEDARELVRKQQIEDVRQLLETPPGQRWFKRLGKNGFFFQTTMQGNNSVLNEGRRMFAVDCLHEVALANPDVCARLFVELLLERKEERTDERRGTKARRG